MPYNALRSASNWTLMTNTLAASTCAAMAMASLNDASETPPGFTATYTAIITR